MPDNEKAAEFPDESKQPQLKRASQQQSDIRRHQASETGALSIACSERIFGPKAKVS